MHGLNIAENIIRLCHDRKITQKDLADFIGVTKASVSKWESGRSIPDVLLLPRIAAFFDVTVDELMGYEAKLSREQIQKIYSDLCKGFADCLLRKPCIRQDYMPAAIIPVIHFFYRWVFYI